MIILISLDNIYTKRREKIVAFEQTALVADGIGLAAHRIPLKDCNDDLVSFPFLLKGSEMMSFKTINVSAECAKIPASTLRRMLAKGELPGFYSGNRFYVNYEMLLEKLEQDSLNAMSGKASTSA